MTSIDLRRVLADGDRHPGKRATGRVVHDGFDAAKRELNMQIQGAPSQRRCLRDRTLLQHQSPLALAALMPWRPRALLSIFELFNILREEFDSPDADNAPALLSCSFCSLSLKPHSPS